MHTRATLLALLTLCGLSACNAPRALPSVREHGDRAFKAGQFDTARADYQEYITRKPGEAEVEMMLARTHLRLNEPSEALVHAQIAYDLKPGVDEYIEVYSEALFQSGKTDTLYRFLRGLAQDRGEVGDYLRLGRFTARMGDPDGAEQAYINAATMDKGRTVAPQLALADFYKSIGDATGEKQRLRMALYLEPTNPEIMRRLRELGEIPGPSLALKPKEAP